MKQSGGGTTNRLYSLFLVAIRYYNRGNIEAAGDLFQECITILRKRRVAHVHNSAKLKIIDEFEQKAKNYFEDVCTIMEINKAVETGKRACEMAKGLETLNKIHEAIKHYGVSKNGFMEAAGIILKRHKKKRMIQDTPAFVNQSAEWVDIATILDTRIKNLKRSLASPKKTKHQPMESHHARSLDMSKISNRNKQKVAKFDPEEDIKDYLSGKTKHPTHMLIAMSKDLESVLKKKFGAKGRGLHTYITSVQKQHGGVLHPTVVRKMRFVATIRNKWVHEEETTNVPNWNRLIQDYRYAKAELLKI